MKEPAIPADEPYRIEALRALRLLDTPAEADFDTIVTLAQRLFAVPIALITFVDSSRQWFKARCGLDATETERRVSFCGHAILGDEVFVIPDARHDERFHDNPLVTGAPFIRFYAGAPIRLPSGYTIGTVCIISPEPRPDFGAEDRKALAQLAQVTIGIIAVRALRAEMDEARRTADRYLALVYALPQPVAFLDRDGRIDDANEAFVSLAGREPEGLLLTEVLAVADGSGLSSGEPAAIRLADGSMMDILQSDTGRIVIGRTGR